MLCKFQNSRIRECTLVWWISKPKIRSSWEHFQFSLQFHLCPRSVVSQSIFQGRMKERLALTCIPIHVSCCCSKNSVCFSPNHWLSNWASLLGLSNWALVCGLEWDQNGTNKTLAPMGLGLFCQLLISPKLQLIIFNTTI